MRVRTEHPVCGGGGHLSLCDRLLALCLDPVTHAVALQPLSDTGGSMPAARPG